MKVRYCKNPQTFHDAAAAVGVCVEVNHIAGNSYRVKLFPDKTTKDSDGDYQYQRTSASWANTDRRVFAVCWHGFRDFFRACFDQEPDLVFNTALDTWRGSDDFEARYQDSGWRIVGAPICPVTACEVCRCPESGTAY